MSAAPPISGRTSDAALASTPSSQGGVLTSRASLARQRPEPGDAMFASAGNGHIDSCVASTALRVERGGHLSVSPFPVSPEPTSLDHQDDSAPHLRLVPAHDHAWRLRSVEYDEGLEVRRYECVDCDDVLFR